jgi:predicted enzyme related to lactoylglutathione lyase
MAGQIVHIEIPADDTAGSQTFDVDDIKAGVAHVNELGGKAGDPMPVPSMGWFSTCTDPHGNEFGLWQTDASAA